MGGISSEAIDLGSDPFEMGASRNGEGPDTEETEVQDVAQSEFSSDLDGLDDEVAAQARSFLGHEDPEEDSEEDSESVNAGAEEDAEESAPQKKTGSRADKRIQGLISDLKTRDSELQKLREHNEAAQRQWQQYIFQQQQQSAESAQQQAVLQKELEIIRQQQSLADEEHLDPVEKLKRQIERETLQKAQTQFGGEIDAVRQQYQALIQQQQEQQARYERQQRIAAYDAEATQAANNLLSRVEPNIAKGMLENVKTQILNYGAGLSMLPAEAAKEWQKVAYQYVLADLKSRNKRNGETLRKSQAMPQTNPGNRRVAKGKKRVTHEEARKRGFANALEAMTHDGDWSWAGQGTR